jgi:putative DNA methylase
MAPEQHIKDEGVAGRMGARMFAIVTKSGDGRSFYEADNDHIRVALSERSSWRPDYPTSTHPQYMAVPRYGMDTFAKLFSERQLIALTTFSDLLADVKEQVCEDASEVYSDEVEYANAVVIYLAFAVDKVAESSTQLCAWSPLPSKLHVVNTFGRQALPMIWDYAESNPFADSSGNLARMADLIAKVLEQQHFEERIEGDVRQRNATDPITNLAKALISTDPPYYDNVPYADISDFFYVWMRRNLNRVCPEVFSTVLVPKEAELVADHQRWSGRENANAHFETGLRQAFSNLREIVSQAYPISVYYAFKQTESLLDDDNESGQVISSTGWETMLEGLIQSGFTVDGTWPMRTERSGGFRNKDRNTLASSIVLVCRPRPEDAPITSRREFVNALRRELPIALKKMQSGSIAPVDLAQASIGPGMAVYSRYSRVLEADGSPLTVRTALQLINQELDAFLAETEGDVDADTRFCINWFEQFGFKEDEFGRADVLARAKNTSVDGLVNAGVIAAGAGKVQLRHWKDLEPGWTPQEDKRVTVWECVHHLIERINTYGESGAAALLMRMNSDLAAEAKNLAYRLYQICDRKGWAEYALEYNALVLSWPRLQELANELKQNQPPEQLGLF